MMGRERAAHLENAAPARLERVLCELVRLQGFRGGRFFDAALDLEELAAADGGLPLFLAQAAAWAEFVGMPHLVEGHAIVADANALTQARAVRASRALEPAPPDAPLLFLLNHVVHLARDAGAEETLALETVVEPQDRKSVV